MRYQKLITQETTWKWQYLLKKHREGENITKYEEQSLIDLKVSVPLYFAKLSGRSGKMD